MKIAKKKVVVILSVLLAAILIIAIFFPGLPWYIRIKKEYEYIDKSLELFPDSNTVPENYVEYSVSGVSLLAPEGLEITEDNNIGKGFANDSVEIFITELTPDDYIINFKGEIISEENLQQFCDFSSLDFPQSNYDKYNLQLSLSMDNFNIHNRKQSETFYKLADYRDSWFGHWENIYRFDKENFKGFLRIHDLGEYLSGQAMIFPDSNPDNYIMITISPEKREDIFKIADTIRLTE